MFVGLNKGVGVVLVMAKGGEDGQRRGWEAHMREER